MRQRGVVCRANVGKAINVINAKRAFNLLGTVAVVTGDCAAVVTATFAYGAFDALGFVAVGTRGKVDRDRGGLIRVESGTKWRFWIACLGGIGCAGMRE